MNTLALDLGTNTGWAIYCNQQLIDSGTWNLATSKELLAAKKKGLERRMDIRFVKLHGLILKTIRDYVIQRIVFEDVLFMSTQSQAQLWARLSAAIWGAVLSRDNPIEIEAVPVGTLKKFATGSGSADKNFMAEALYRRYPSVFKMRVEQERSGKETVNKNVLTKLLGNSDADDNEVDAIWLGEYSAKVNLGEISFTSIWDRKQEKQQKKKQKIRS